MQANGANNCNKTEFAKSRTGLSSLYYRTECLHELNTQENSVTFANVLVCVIFWVMGRGSNFPG